jgi:hypothetical protein
LEILKNLTELTSNLSILLPVVITGILAIREIILNKYRPRHRTKTRQNISKIYFELNKIVATGAKRAIILTAEPPPTIKNKTSKIFGSIKYEIFENPLETATNNWNRQFLTGSYKNMLLELQNKNTIILRTENLDLPILKNLNKSEGVNKSFIFYIKTHENEMIYLSIDYTKDIVLTAKENAAINSAVNALRNIFNDDQNL